ncbi:TPA: alpha/beta hydrolase [Aeromonas salmonicida]|nr:alpha/beta hydrolase [Aeromonas salmonicida]
MNFIGLSVDDEKIENVLVDVNYATNRKPSGDQSIFSDSRDGQTNYGVATVSIPKNEHCSGNVERPFEFLSFTFRENKNKHFVLESGKELNESDFFDKIETDSGSKKLILFIHGYNVSFKDAVFKAAQIKYDLMFEFPIILFSWPSKGSVASYVSDKESALYSSSALNNLLKKISELNIEEVMVVGHSMGTFCLAEALKSFTANSASFKRLILAAADIQKEAFLDIYAHKIINTFDMVSLYASSSDKALIVSKIINEFERVGDTRDDILVIDGVESIDMSGADENLFSLRHSYVSESNKALDDMYHFLINGLPASKRRLKEMFNKQAMRYWSINN